MDKRKSIQEAALKLFVEFGFHNTPTSKIAKESGVATGTLFYFYATKDILVTALYLDIKGRINECITLAIKDEIALKGIMKAYYAASLNWAVQHQTEFRFIQQFNASPYLNQVAAQEIEKHITPVIVMLKEGIEDKIIKPLDVEIIFRLISGHTFSIFDYLADKKFSEAKQDEVIGATFDMLWKMIT